MPPRDPEIPERRLRWFTGLLLLWAFIVAGRLVQLQLLRYGEFHEWARRQQQRTFEVSARRGNIYDRNGRELAMSVNVDSVFAVPGEVRDQEVAAALLAKILNTEPREILARLKASHAFCWIARKVDSATADRIRTLKLQGIYFQKEPRRFYPKRDLAAQALGYVGMDDEGLSGLEQAFDGELHGIPGRMSIQRDARGRYFSGVEHEPQPGENLVLTIDEKIQAIAERELQRGMEETHALAGTAIVENPATGEILALANRPNFNPNDTRHVTPAQLKDRAVSDIYEPGSTFKIVTVAAALEEHVTRPEEPIDCQMGSIVVAGQRIHDSRPHGVLDVTHVIAESSDVGAIKIGMRLGEQKFDRYVRSFGFGSPSGVELPAETRGLYKPINRWSKVSMAAMSMGQEIGISAVQLAGLISTIANGGVYVAPRIVAADVPGGHFGMDPKFQSVSLSPTSERRVISPETAQEMKQMLRAVVVDGTARGHIDLPGYSSAGKTGTAQKVDPATHAYSKTKYVGSFAGFAPMEHPAVVIAVILDSAVGLHQGGQVAAPVFGRIARQVLAYWNVPHDLELAPDNRKRELRAAGDLPEGSPDHIGGVLDEGVPSDPGEKAAPLAQVEAQLTAPGPISSTTPVPAALKLPPRPAAGAASRQPEPPQPVDGAVVVNVDGGQEVPSFIGKPLRAAVEIAQEAGIEIEPAGSGIARE
ncbi:MAG: penicillin-binding protein, partial [Acidobacteria bacterium]|nr:penicillin-binding protein [Acidobacteriota bacterium]